jgi:signal transduction histidine kinase
MKHASQPPAIGVSALFPTAAFTIGIFTVDTLTDPEIAVAVFYVVIVLMSIRFCRKRGVMLVAAGCMALTLLSYLLTVKGSPASALANAIISLAVIGTTTYLILRIESMEVALHEARTQLTHIGRVTALGELVALIAHEVTQPLTAVVTSGNACLRWLASKPPNVEKAKQSVARILKDANRASLVVERVRRLAKKAPPQKSWLNINETVQEIIALTRREVEQSHISLKTQLSNDLLLICADRTQLQQVILNLIVNAMEAINACGEGPRELLVSTAKENSTDVHLAVRDSGRGLSPGALDDIFNAFETTKPDGMGMGMGLAISRSIIEAHGGRVWATPSWPRGAVFQFTLPTGQEQAS